MYYSLTFDDDKNTWDSWGLIALEPPMIPPPEPNRNLVNIPGRRAGPIDLSLVPFGELTYQRITGTWQFVREETHNTARFEVYESIRKSLHGKTMKVMTEDDPFHYFMGTFAIGEPVSGPNTVEIPIEYDLEPVRYNLDGTEDTTYIYRGEV